MKENTFLAFQIFLIKLYVKLILIFNSSKSENDIELDFIKKYSLHLRKANNFIIKFRNYLINKCNKFKLKLKQKN